MADYVASTSCINLYMQIAGVVKHKGFKPQTSHFRTVHRSFILFYFSFLSLHICTFYFSSFLVGIFCYLNVGQKLCGKVK